MAGTSLLALIDDIASLLDDVGALTKVAARKTVGVLGDDLALNAEQVAGVRAERELPVVWAVAKGSALNKLILVPSALALSYTLPWVITPLLVIGGAYLTYEGFEKVLHSFSKQKDSHEKQLEALAGGPGDLRALEAKKIKGAIRTDFILSAEIVVISLGTVQEQPFWMRAAVVTAMAAVLTIGVYVLVAGIVKMDDAGLLLARDKANEAKQAIGKMILWIAPRLLRVLSILGTIAMFLVGGGIIVHGIPFLHHAVHGATRAVGELPSLGALFAALLPSLLGGGVGVVVGAALVLVHHLVRHAIQPSDKP